MVAAAVLACLLIGLDAKLGKDFFGKYSLLALSPSAARSILSTIVGAMVTSTGVVFSITIVALSLASSQFGSRLIRTYRNRRSTHFTLGIFVSTSLYCILVLATIREVDGYQFVPTISVATGIVLTVICLATLIYYIDDISTAIQAPNVIQSSATDLQAAIDRMFPTKLGESRGKKGGDKRTDDEAYRQLERELQQPNLVVECDEVGYINAIENESVIDLASTNQFVIRLLVHPGDFIQEGVLLGEIFCRDNAQRKLTEDEADEFSAKLRGCLIVGSNRTPTRDLRYAFNELVEIAVRALSPGINDPFTAINCVDRIHAALSELRRREVPSSWRVDKNNNLCAIATPISYRECVDGSLSVIRHYASGNPMVLDRIEKAMKELG